MVKKKIGKICEWYENKGYGMINCDGDLFRLNYRYLPFYADQRSVKVGMKVLFRSSAFQGHWQASDVEIPDLKGSVDEDEEMTGEINSWETDKGYGMVRTSYGKLIGINWRQCPAYANQYSIKVGMKVKFKLGEFNKRATAIDCQFPELKPRLGKRRKGHFVAWDVDKGYGMIESESGKSFRANWRELPNYAPQLTVEVGMQAVFREGEFDKLAVAEDIAIPCLIPPVGATVSATDDDGEWEGLVKKSDAENTLYIAIDSNFYPLSNFKTIIVTKLPIPAKKMSTSKPPRPRSLSPISPKLSDSVNWPQPPEITHDPISHFDSPDHISHFDSTPDPIYENPDPIAPDPIAPFEDSISKFDDPLLKYDAHDLSSRFEDRDLISKFEDRDLISKFEPHDLSSKFDVHDLSSKFDSHDLSSKFDSHDLSSKFDSHDLSSKFDSHDLSSKFDDLSSKFESRDPIGKFEARDSLSKFEVRDSFSKFEVHDLASKFDSNDLSSKFEARDPISRFDDSLSKFDNPDPIFDSSDRFEPLRMSIPPGSNSRISDMSLSEISMSTHSTDEIHKPFSLLPIGSMPQPQETEPVNDDHEVSGINCLPEGHAAESAPSGIQGDTQHASKKVNEVLSRLFPSAGRGCKLRKYLPTFLEEEVDSEDILQELDHEQLIELGVNSKLDRNKILVRIKNLFGSAI